MILVCGVFEPAGLQQISVKTIETHRAEVMKRLGIHDLAGLVRYAIQVGIVSALVHVALGAAGPRGIASPGGNGLKASAASPGS
ncbi:MAG: LuxR C-terminal-related transcriptional regulator [Gemmatimonadales bacterium]